MWDHIQSWLSKGKGGGHPSGVNIQYLPDNITPYRKRIIQMVARYGVDGSLQHLDEEIRKNPNELILLEIKIDILLDLDRFKEAEAYCLEALIKHKDSIDMHEKMAETLDMSGRPADSLPYYDTAIRLCKRQGADKHHLFRLYNNKGLALMGMGKFDEALVYLDMAIKAEPDSATAYDSKGLVLREMGDFKGSKEYFKIAKRLDPNHITQDMN